MIIRHEVGVPGLKRALILLLFLLPAILMCVSCGSSNTAGTQTTVPKYRALVTNRVSAGSLSAGVYTVDAENDLRANVSPISAGNTPGMMVVTPNQAETVVFSGNGTLSSDNQLTIINNGTGSAAGHVNLPGMTESFVVSPDSSTVYVAVPTAPVVGQSALGIVEAIALSNGTVLGQVDVPSVHYLSIDHSGNRILGFSDNSDSVAVITPSNIEIPNAVAVTYVSGFDRPVQAFFSSDDSNAYVVNCGAECGGNTASVEQFSLIDNTLSSYVPACVPIPATNPVQCSSLAAGSFALLNGSTMYLAGTPPYVGGAPQQPCTGQTTAANSCGLLTIVDLSSMSVVNTAPIVITDGYHDRMALGPNGQLFIGAHTCAEIVPPVPPPTGAEVRGCLSIYNTLNTAVGSVPTGGVVIPPENGDVTGIQPITQRGDIGTMAQEVVYVIQGENVQGGSLYIYDDTIDALEFNPHDSSEPGRVSDFIGDFVDVKTVDF